MRIRTAVAATLVALLAAPLAAEDFDLSLHGVFDLRGISAGDETSWRHQGLGKARWDEADEPGQLGALLVELSMRPQPTLELRFVGSLYDSGAPAIDISEAFLRWKPVPGSAWQWQAKLGAFYPPFSLENGDVGWSSPYTISFSALDTWLGEEIRAIGAEVELVHNGHFTGSDSEFRLHASAFGWNDPAGALVAWRGFALHDRQTRLFEEIPLAELPAFSPTGSFRIQEPRERPFTEMDDRAGWYLGGEWDYGELLRVKLDHYDNRADPTVVVDGQWAWHTKFDVVGIAATLPGKLDLLLGAMSGRTYMEGRRGEVDAPFRTAYLLLSQEWGRQRASLRFDSFEVLDRDETPDDPNEESGDAWTLAWFYGGEEIPRWGSWRIGLEALRVRSRRPARLLLGGDEHETNETLQLSLAWRF